MGALPKAPVSIDYYFFFGRSAFSGNFWVSKKKRRIAPFNSQAIAGLGGRR